MKAKRRRDRGTHSSNRRAILYSTKTRMVRSRPAGDWNLLEGGDGGQWSWSHLYTLEE